MEISEFRRDLLTKWNSKRAVLARVVGDATLPMKEASDHLKDLQEVLTEIIKENVALDSINDAFDASDASISRTYILICEAFGFEWQK